MKRLNKAGFTLIELLAVIVILGILMLIAIPSVTKYIDSSKKKTYITNAQLYIDAVRNDVIAGEIKSPKNNSVSMVYLSDITLEKGNNKSPYGEYIEDKSYVLVVNQSNSLSYYFNAIDEKGYAIKLTKEDDLATEKITKETNAESDMEKKKFLSMLLSSELTTGFIHYDTGEYPVVSNGYPNAQYNTNEIILKGGQEYSMPTSISTDLYKWRLYSNDGIYIPNAVAGTANTVKRNEDTKLRMLWLQGYTSDIKTALLNELLK